MARLDRSYAHEGRPMSATQEAADVDAYAYTVSITDTQLGHLLTAAFEIARRDHANYMEYLEPVVMAVLKRNREAAARAERRQRYAKRKASKMESAR
jgi:hypothetical protein